MKHAIIIFGFVAAVTALPYQHQHRPIRDVSEIVDAEPQNIYLPPVEPLATVEPPVAENVLPSLSLANANANVAADDEVADAATEAVPETAVLGENGYEYRVIRKLRLRRRRDVSHLNLAYLPPAAEPKVELNYLPPHLDVPQTTQQLKISNEYLPPVNEKVVVKEQTTEAIATEVAETEAPTTEVASTEASTTQAPTTEAPTTQAAETTTAEAPTTAAPTIPSPILKESTHLETAILAEDGYHYRKPDVLPDLGMATPEVEPQPQLMYVVDVISDSQQQPEPGTDQDTVLLEVPEQTVIAEPELAYLPPLKFGVLEAEGPGEETSALLDDGYHYRVVKNVRLF